MKTGNSLILGFMFLLCVTQGSFLFASWNGYGGSYPNNGYGPAHYPNNYPSNYPPSAPYPQPYPPAPYNQGIPGYGSQNFRYITVDISGSNMPKLDLISRSDPYLKFFGNGGGMGYGSGYGYARRNNGRRLVHRTHTIRNSHSPYWGAITLDLFDLTGGNLNQQVFVELWDEDRGRKDDKIGYFYLDFARLVHQRAPMRIRVIPTSRTRRVPTITIAPISVY